MGKRTCPGNNTDCRRNLTVMGTASGQGQIADVADVLDHIAERIDHCRLQQGCGARACGAHAVGKPTHQLGMRSEILVVGEAPGPSGWWLSGRAFYSRTADGQLSLSQTGINLNTCLAVLGTRIEDIGFVEAVRCRPPRAGSWSPGNRLRKRCLPYLREHVQATNPRLILPLGWTATASCLEIAGRTGPGRLEEVVGRPLSWPVPWGICWILPLYHPSPANNGRWPVNRPFLSRFAENKKAQGIAP
jgi:uracil-DNA glycosylase family 4